MNKRTFNGENSAAASTNANELNFDFDCPTMQEHEETEKANELIKFDCPTMQEHEETENANELNFDFDCPIQEYVELCIKRGWYSTFEEVKKMGSTNLISRIYGVKDKGFRLFLIREKDGIYLDFFIILGINGKLEDYVYKQIWKIKLGNERIGSRKNTLNLINSTIKAVFLGDYDYLFKKLIPEGQKVIISWSAPDSDPWTSEGNIVEITDDGIKVYIDDSRVNNDKNLICECKKKVEIGKIEYYVVPMNEGIDCCALIRKDEIK